MKNFWKLILKWLGLDKKKQDKPEPETTNDEASHSFSHATPITDELKLTGMYPNKVTFSGNVRDWKEGLEEGCHGEFHVFVVRGDKWIGGKVDHVRNNTFDRDFNNLHEKFDEEGNVVKRRYQDWDARGEPDVGETVAMLFINYAKTRRTNAVFSEWK